METQMTKLNQVITADQYFKSVSALIKVARLDTSGSRAAAQVLLSAYNGEEWQLDVTDLCCLDPVNMQHAMMVIEGRVCLMREPHEGIDHGDKIFSELCYRWRRLNINNRHLRICRDCNGTGKVCENFDDENVHTTKVCRYCDENDFSTQVCPYCEGKGYC